MIETGKSDVSAKPVNLLSVILPSDDGQRELVAGLLTCVWTKGECHGVGAQDTMDL